MRGTIWRVTSARRGAAPGDLARLRRVRDRIDREYAQPLDVEALARGAHMSAGHLSRQFRLAYGESPYGYLMTRRIERAMALLRRGDLSVTEVCFEVGCSSLGTFSTRFTELVGVPPSVYRRDAARRDGGDAVLRGQAGDQTDQESRSAAARAAPSLTAMDITIHQLPPARRPGRRPGLLSRHARLRGPQRRRLRRDALDHRRPRRPARHVHRPDPPGADPGITDDERRTIAEMMAKGTYASINLATNDLDATFERLQARDAEIVQEPTDQPYGVRDCAVRDPAGNLIRIQELR